MSSIPGIAQGESAQVTGSARLVGPLCAIALGLVLVYLAGFAQAEALHDGAHDSRHSAAFPCH